MWGFCEVTQSVTSSLAERYCASAARGSIALGMSRWLMIRSLTTTSAALNAASTSPPETFQWKQTLPGTSAWSWGCALLRRLLGVGDRRQRLVVDLDRVGRVAREVAVLGDDDRHRVADVAHRVDRDRRVGRGLRVGARARPTRRGCRRSPRPSCPCR